MKPDIDKLREKYEYSLKVYPSPVPNGIKVVVTYWREGKFYSYEHTITDRHEEELKKLRYPSVEDSMETKRPEDKPNLMDSKKPLPKHVEKYPIIEGPKTEWEKEEEIVRIKTADGQIIKSIKTKKTEDGESLQEPEG